MHKDFEFEGTYDIIVGKAWWEEKEDSWSLYIVNQEAKSEQEVKMGIKHQGLFPVAHFLQ